MAISTKPIPALYTVYVLRSTVRHASLYIGSTPNPPRRLKQHNGLVRGGAARTSRKSLRPWEMVALVSGFPSMVAALKFEWALTNPHLSLHIPSESRISRASGVKRNGAPKRPRPGMASVMSNIHLLLRVPSFDRWPLRMHLFVRAAHAAWRTSCAGAGEALREDVQVLTDLGSEEEASRPGTAASSSARTGKTTTAQTGDPEAEADGDSDERTAPWGIHSLALDYEPMKDHVEKGQSIVTFEREGRCIICDEEMEHGKGLHVVCSGSGCEGIGHLSCWSRHLLGQEGKDGTGGESEEALIPVRGRCPSCRDEVRWEDLMRELTLRMRGQKEVEKLLKTTTKRRRAKG